MNRRAAGLHDRLFRAAVFAALWTSVVGSALASDRADVVTVRTAEGRTTSIDRARWATLARASTELSDHGARARYEGVPLASVLEAAGVELAGLRGPALSDAVIVEAADGYRVIFSVGEIAPELGHSSMLLADRRDGHGLDDHEGPLRLVVEGDSRPARSVRGVTRLTLIHVGLR